MPTETLPVVRPQEDIAVTATLPEEMIEAQHKLIEWARNKVASVKAEADELDQAWQHAKQMKWRWDLLHRTWGKAVKTWQYYTKILGALEAGYNIVPNFDVTLFAVRKNTKAPTPTIYVVRWQTEIARLLEIKAKALPAGTGDYVSNNPDTDSIDIEDNKMEVWASDWKEVDFPFTMAKPQVMEATSRAMAIKVFDDFGILPKFRSADPVIVGRIRHPHGVYAKYLTFLIAWHLDTRTL